jgi:hypothetical protein
MSRLNRLGLAIMLGEIFMALSGTEIYWINIVAFALGFICFILDEKEKKNGEF